MKTKSIIFSAFVATAVLASCGKEELANKQTDAALNFRSGSGSFSITADWEEGAATPLNGTTHTAQNNTVKVWNNFSNGTSGRIGFQRWDQSGNGSFGRTNGAGDNGTATHAFAFKRTTGTAWTAKVPFAFGTQGSSEAIWTPLRTGGVPLVYMGIFVTDNSNKDEDATAGIIEVGDFRTLDEDVRPGGAANGRVIFQKWNGSSWSQISRTNGSGDNGNLLAFTVLKVRTGYTVSGGKVTAETWSDVPVAKIDRGSKKRLSTAIYGNNIGTLTMLEY
jgi:hypothetical protein